MSAFIGFPWWFDPDVVTRLWHGIRTDPTDFVVPHESDSELLELLVNPFRSVDDVVHRLGELEARLIAHTDRRSVFLTIYTEMTAHTAQAIDDDVFDDSEWMRRYLIRFAEYYRRAFYAFEDEAVRDVPDPWIVAFGTAVRGDALVVQDAFLGINAHIVYDLALTLSDIGIDPDRRLKYADHRRIDDILARLVSVQRTLLAEQYAPGLSRVGARMAGMDERWSVSTLRGARETAWRIAAVRSDTKWGPVETYTEWVLSQNATGGASLLLSPAVSSSMMDLLHDIEADTVDLTAYARTFHDRATYGTNDDLAEGCDR